MGSQFVVEVVSAQNMLPELFTKKGAGTYITFGYLANEFDSIADLDYKKLDHLAKTSIGKEFKPGYATSQASKIYLEPDYHGVVILKDIDGVPYMDKFLVDKEHQGNGLGKSLFQKALDYHGQLIWRAKPDNIFNGKYFEWCDRAEKNVEGKGTEWNVFSIGLDDDQWKNTKYQVANLTETLS